MNRTIGRFGEAICKRAADVNRKLPARRTHRRILPGESSSDTPYAAGEESLYRALRAAGCYPGVADSLRHSHTRTIAPRSRSRRARVLLLPVVRHLLLLRLLFHAVQIRNRLSRGWYHVDLRVINDPRRAPRVSVVHIRHVEKEII